MTAERRFAVVRGELPGPRSRELRAVEAPYLAPGTQQISTLSGLAMVRGEGALLHDADDNTFIDFVAGIGTAFPAAIKNGIAMTAANVDRSWIGRVARVLYRKI